MKPIRAIYNYTVEVPVEIGNPLHVEFLGGKVAIEPRQTHGFITDIIILDDVGFEKLLDGIETDKDGKKTPSYKEEMAHRSGVYVVFWEDRGDDYKMYVRDYSSFTVSNKEMRNYVAKTA